MLQTLAFRINVYLSVWLRCVGRTVDCFGIQHSHIALPSSRPPPLLRTRCSFTHNFVQHVHRNVQPLHACRMLWNCRWCEQDGVGHAYGTAPFSHIFPFESHTISFVCILFHFRFIYFFLRARRHRSVSSP